MIEFKKEKEITKFYNPQKNVVEQREIEIRYDPLTGKSSRILEKTLPISDEPDMGDLKNPEFCPFCSENIYKVGARDIEVLSKEILIEGESVVLANVTPYTEVSLVIRLTNDHYLPLSEFKEKHFNDGFKVAITYLKKYLRKTNNSFISIIMNYLKPAGSSITHPHMQLLISDNIMDYQRRLMNNATKFYDNEEKNYWKDLLDIEKDGKRFIGKTNGFTWIAPFSPRGLEHIQGISLQEFLYMDEDSIHGLSEGIVNTLQYYSSLNRNSFNFWLFIPPFDKRHKLATLIDIVCRSNLDKFYWNDVFAMSKLIDEPFANRTPESTARAVKEYF